MVIRKGTDFDYHLISNGTGGTERHRLFTILFPAITLERVRLRGEEAQREQILLYISK